MTMPLIALLAVMTAKDQANASVELAAGTARCMQALSDPSKGESGIPRQDMSKARTIEVRAAASSISVAPNSARHIIARPSTGRFQSRLP
jgi:hypothetical protein